MIFNRADRSFLSEWWWTIDKWLLLAIGLLLAVGVLLTFSASPPVAERIGVSGYFFVKRHLFFVPLAFLVMAVVSLMSLKNLRILSFLGVGASLFLLVLVLLMGAEIKGARRWIDFMGFSLQPSEFIKPFLTILWAWLFTKKRNQMEKITLFKVPLNWPILSLFGLTLMLLLLQPDVGMTFVITAIFFTQLFLAGLPWFWIIILGVFGLGTMVGLYHLFPHVQSRIDRFLQGGGDDYQVDQALKAFQSGGFFGTGPGEGKVKQFLPDGHTDFIFAVAGEEFGAALCLLLLLLFLFIVLRGLSLARRQSDLFIMLAAGGLIVQFGLQATLNMASTMHLIPTEGSTLPFISYGGSSMLSFAFTMGALLALTKRRLKHVS